MQRIILKYSNLFKLIYSLHNVFTSWILNLPPKIRIKHSLLRNIVFLHTPSSKSLEKQQRDTLLSDRLEIRELGIYFAKEPHRPQIADSHVYLEVINFCGSQPCSTSREQRYYGLIDLKPRTSVRNLFKILQRGNSDDSIISEHKIVNWYLQKRSFYSIQLFLDKRQNLGFEDHHYMQKMFLFKDAIDEPK